eukprot:1030140-Amphidinium_carterae.1
MTKEERRQVLEEVRTELDEEVRNVWEPACGSSISTLLAPLDSPVRLWEIPSLMLGMCPETRCGSILDTTSTTVRQGIPAAPECMPTKRPMYTRNEEH